MSTDRELLELAAKAADIDWCAYHPDRVDNCSLCLQPNGRIWNPLADDGDALRLAVKLELLSGPDFWREMSVQCAMAALRGEKQDPYATTRRSIVWAAAEIGRAAP